MIPYIEDEFMKSIEICIRESEIEILDMFSTYVKETQLASLYEEADKDNKGNNKFIELMKKIRDTVLNTISNVLRKISDLISGGKDNHVNIDDYLNSREGRIQLNYDLDEVHKKVLNETAKGRRFIQLIARGTKVEPGVINEFYNNSVKFLSDNSTSVKSVVQAGAVAKSYSKYTKMYDDIRKDKGLDGIFTKVTDVEDQKLITKCYNGMCNYTNKSLKVFSNFMNDYNKLSLKENKKG